MLPFLLMLAADTGPYPRDFDCNDYRDGSTVAMVECAGKQADVWDKRLNVEYRAALKRGEVDKSQLIKAQRLWLRYRDENCATYSTVKGTIHRILEANCWRNMTRDRTVELHEMTWIG